MVLGASLVENKTVEDALVPEETGEKASEVQSALVARTPARVMLVNFMVVVWKIDCCLLLQVMLLLQQCSPTSKLSCSLLLRSSRVFQPLVLALLGCSI